MGVNNKEKLAILKIFFSAVFTKCKREECSVEFLENGITNKNFLIKIAGRPRFVLRKFSETAKLLGINREHEFANARIASFSGFSPKVVHFNPKQRVLITEYAEGRIFTSGMLTKKTTVKKLSEVLRKLHGSKNIFRGNADILRIIKSYAKKAMARGAIIPKAAQKAFENSSQEYKTIFEKKIRPVSVPKNVPSHLDLLGNNIIFAKDKVLLIDWEYSAMADPFFDLSLISALNDFNSKQDLVLLKAYFGRNLSSNHVLCFKIFKKLVITREMFWGILQSVVSKLEVNYNEYTQKQIKRYGNIAQQYE